MMEFDELQVKAKALAEILTADIFDNLSNHLTSDESYIAAAALSRTTAVFARLFHDMHPNLLVMFKEMIDVNIEETMKIKL